MELRVGDQKGTKKKTYKRGGAAMREKNKVSRNTSERPFKTRMMGHGRMGKGDRGVRIKKITGRNEAVSKLSVHYK